MNVLSLGAGVQSTTLLLASLNGTLPPFDWVVFADTGDEPAAVYAHLDRLRDLTPITTVTAGHLADTVTGTFMPVPLYRERGSMGKRQCTSQYKVRPIHRWLRSIGATTVNLALGISVDEIERARTSRLQWCRNVYPLLQLGWTRADCQQYLADHWSHPVPRSACVYCPLKSNQEWLTMRDTEPDDWARAVAFDQAARPFGYVHRSARPLATAVLRPEDAGQLTLALECEGHCGL